MKLINQTQIKAMTEQLTPRFVGRDQDHLIALADEAADAAYDAAVDLTGPLFDFKADLEAAGGSDLVGFQYLDDGSVVRSVYDKLSDFVNAKDFGAVGDGTTDDKAALDFAMAAAVVRGIQLSLDGTKTYGINGFLSFPSNLKLRTNGAVFRDLVGTTSNTPFITVGANNTIDEIRIEIPSGIRRDRGIVLNADGTQVERLFATSVDQQANTVDNDDGAVRIAITSGVRVRHIEVENFDQAINCNTSTDLQVYSTKITNYVRGLWVEDCISTKFTQGSITGASPNASYTAGHTGILLSSSSNDAQRNLTISDFVVEDSGEHGIRVGGPAQQTNVYIVRPRVKNVGGSGIKILGTDIGTPTDLNRRVHIIDPIIEDCGSGALTDNMCGILIMFADQVYVTNPIIRKENKLYSGAHGIRIAASSNVYIIQPLSRDAQSDGIYLDGSSGNLSNVSIRGGMSRENGRDGFRFDIDTSSVDNILVDGLWSYLNSGLGFTWIATGGAGTTGRPRLRLYTGGNIGGAGACDSNAVTLHITGGVGATPMAGVFARNGSMWDNETTLNIRKAGAWAAL